MHIRTLAHSANSQLSLLQTTTMIQKLLLLLHPFNGHFSRTMCVSRHQKGKPFRILLEQEMMGWQWHQLDHMQIICTLLQTDNHTSTPTQFLQAGCSSCHPTNSIKALKANDPENEIVKEKPRKTNRLLLKYMPRNTQLLIIKYYQLFATLCSSVLFRVLGSFRFKLDPLPALLDTWKFPASDSPVAFAWGIPTVSDEPLAAVITRPF